MTAGHREQAQLAHARSFDRGHSVSRVTRNSIVILLSLPAMMVGFFPRATAALPVREALVEGVHKGPWVMTSCTWTNCEDLSRRTRLEWGFSSRRGGIDLTSYSGDYHVDLRWLPDEGIYRGTANIAPYWRRQVVLRVVERERIDGVWTATELVGTTRVWARSAPRYHDTGRFTLNRRFGLGRLVFQSEQDLFIMDGDGTDRHAVGGICEGFEPSWRPSTQQIAFIHKCGPTGTFEVSVVSAHGTGFRQMMTSDQDDFGPDWSTDGRLALSSWATGDAEIYTMAADGSDVVQITSNPALDFYPSWSPDGSQIAFTSDRDGDFDIYVMDADGADLRQLTSNPADDGTGEGGWGGGPSWSPNGRLIAFESDRSGNLEIYTLNLRTGAVSRITRHHPGIDVNPAFSPDGSRIAFSSRRSGSDFDIYTVGTRGQDLLQVSDRPGDDYQPDWQTR